jgi:hypothetical protein
LWFAKIASPATVGSARASTRLRRRVNDVERRLCDGLYYVVLLKEERAVGIGT